MVTVFDRPNGKAWVVVDDDGRHELGVILAAGRGRSHALFYSAYAPAEHGRRWSLGAGTTFDHALELLQRYAEDPDELTKSAHQVSTDAVIFKPLGRLG